MRRRRNSRWSSVCWGSLYSNVPLAKHPFLDPISNVVNGCAALLWEWYESGYPVIRLVRCGGSYDNELVVPNRQSRRLSRIRTAIWSATEQQGPDQYRCNEHCPVRKCACVQTRPTTFSFSSRAGGESEPDPDSRLQRCTRSPRGSPWGASPCRPPSARACRARRAPRRRGRSSR